MKYTAITLLALALSASALPRGGRHRQGGQGANSASSAVAAASSTAVAAAASSTAAAAAASSTAAAAAAASSTAAATAVNNAGASATTAATAAASTSTAAAAAAGNGTSTATQNNPDLQNSLTLDQSVLATGFLNDGQAVQEAGQVASLTSGNNFINFCATAPNVPITNGQQITTGSCNPAPMGLIPAKTNMPSAKFVNPPNGGTIPPNTAFTIALNIAGMETGHFVNAQQNYFSAPQQLNAQGQVIGHSHVVVEALSSLTQTTPTDPTTFAFFKGLNAAAVNGQLTASVANGLPAGTYKVSTINTAANHQPILVPIAQHGSLDDVVYFTVADAGNATANALGGAAATDTASAAAATSTSTNTAAAAAASSTSTDTAAAAAASSTDTAAAVAASSTSAAAGSTDTAAAAAASATSTAGGAGGKRRKH